MATVKKSVSFKNAEIDFEKGQITETTKDEMRVYDLNEILKEWHGVQNISFTIQQSEDLPAIEDADEQEA